MHGHLAGNHGRRHGAVRPDQAEDLATVDFQVKRQLPNGGITVTIPNNAAPTIGNVWVIWQEPGNLGTFSTGGSDNCPSAVASLGLSPAPRCVYAPFRL